MNFACPYCGVVLFDDGALAGSEVECPMCRGRMIVPGQPMFAAPAPHTTTIVHHYHEEKSPGLAAVLSFLIFGLGQLYNGHFGKAVIFFVCGVLGMLAFVVPGVIIWILGIVDAYQSAEQINRHNRKSHRR